MAAVARLREALDSRQNILVFGDYDVDGVTSLTLLRNITDNDPGTTADLFIRYYDHPGNEYTSATLSATELPSGISLTTVRAVGSTLYATGDNFQTRHAIVRSDDGGATWSTVYEGSTSGIANLAGLAASAERVVTVGGVKSVTLP